MSTQIDQVEPTTALRQFDHPVFGAIRLTDRDGEPWFIAADVCRALELTNSTEALRSLDEDEKTTLSNPEGRPGQPGAKVFNVISESGLYALAFKSRKKEAKAFRRWVTGEVLPALRRNGVYNIQSHHTIPENYVEALRLAANLEEKRAALAATVEAQKPAVEYVERYVKADGAFNIRETAKIMGVQQNVFVAMCLERKVLFREHGTLQPFARWQEAGHFVVKTGEHEGHAFKQTRFTSRGLEWVRRYLKLDELLS